MVRGQWSGVKGGFLDLPGRACKDGWRRSAAAMRYVPFRVIRSCPFCQSTKVRRSRRAGLFESFVLRLVLMRPYRCETCTRRHYNFYFAQPAQEKRPLVE